MANVIFAQLFYTPKIHAINQQNRELLVKYQILQERVEAAQSLVDQIHQRDNNLYRGIFGVDSLNIPQVYQPYPIEKYAQILNDDYTPLMSQSWSSMDNLAKSLYRNSLSLDELETLVKNKEGLSAAIPAIWPIDRTKLRHGIGAFGMRFHPIYGRSIMHKGVDLACDKGDPIYATGDAVVKKTAKGQYRSGYGQEILLDHSFGYQTRYAHLSKILVKAGDIVKRGQIIGEAGSTGGSTGVHLHYEVIYNNQVVNPINYFDRYMTNQDYMDIMEKLQDANYEVIEE